MAGGFRLRPRPFLCWKTVWICAGGWRVFPCSTLFGLCAWSACAICFSRRKISFFVHVSANPPRRWRCDMTCHSFDLPVTLARLAPTAIDHYTPESQRACSLLCVCILNTPSLLFEVTDRLCIAPPASSAVMETDTAMSPVRGRLV